jgi:hypothetical protein
MIDSLPNELTTKWKGAYEVLLEEVLLKKELERIGRIESFR